MNVHKSIVGPGGQSKTWGISLVNVREEHGGQVLSECQEEARNLGITEGDKNTYSILIALWYLRMEK